MSNQSPIFQECLKKYFDTTHFFTPWFEYGKSYVFVFKKNLQVTNIQYSELIALIKVNIRDYKNEDIQVMSVKEFNELTKELFNPFYSQISDETKKYEIFKFIEKQYLELINHLIVMDAFNGSCAVFLPNSMEMDIESICCKSGYVHSCGEKIYLRSISKATKSEFISVLENFIILNPADFKEESRSLFTLYAHEDFTPYDRNEDNNFFSHGLDDLKFYADKLHIESKPIIELVKEIRNNEFLNKFLLIPPAGDYRRNQKSDKQNSIFLITDRAIGENENSRSNIFYYICYNQKYKNENSFHIFEENKPGWINHTTIPHTLMGAMLNRVC